MGFVKERLRKQLAPILAPENTNPCKLNAYRDFRREEGIRTLDTVTRILAFQASSFNHSDTSLFEDCKNRIFWRD